MDQTPRTGFVESKEPNGLHSSNRLLSTEEHQHLFTGKSMTADRFHSHATSRDGPAHRTEIQPQAANNARDSRAAQRDQRVVQTVSAPRTLIALLVAPLAWLAQLGIAELVLGQGCVVGGPLFVVHTMPWTPVTVAIASLVCLVFAVFGALIAWRNLWRTARIPWRFPAALKGTRAERDWFLSRVCALSSTTFVLGLLATDIAMLLIAPCSPW